MSRSRFCLCFAPLVLLAGCGAGDFTDIQSFMEKVRAEPVGSIEPVPKFQPYEAFTYTASVMRSPFQPSVKIDILAQRKGSSDVKPDETRIKQFLEGFNIEIFEMVGTLSNVQGLNALVRGAGGVHRVKVGDFLGRNNGRIISIKDSNIDVIEIVPDGEGGWLERPRSIPLKERA